MQWDGLVGASLWKEAREEARAQADLSVKTDIQGYDIDPGAIDAARANARLAGVDHLIHFQVRDVAALSHPKKYGFLITNPPYGERLLEEDKETLRGLYRTLGERFRAMEDWSMYIITAYEDCGRDVGRKAAKNRKIYNGMMRSYFYSFPGARPPHKTQKERT